jgi:hypothetical protein
MSGIITYWGSIFAADIESLQFITLNFMYRNPKM